MRMQNIYSVIRRSILVIAVVTAHSFFLSAQTGIFYYPNPSENYVNNKLMALTEAPNQEIYLLGKLSNASYEKSIPYFCRVDKRGNLLIEKSISKQQIYDLSALFILNNQRVKVFGSRRQGPIFAPWMVTLNSKGDIIKEKSDYVVYSTIMNDVTDIDGKHLMIAETKVDNNKLYNINLLKLNAENDETLWSKRIKSNLNEEASTIFTLKDGNLLVLGKKYSSDLSDYSPVLYKVNPNGKPLWRVGIPVPDNFYAQDITEDSQGNLIYMCSYSKEYMGTNETRVIKLNSEGQKQSYNVILDISGNGLVMKDNDQFVLYGSNIKVHNKRPITKGKYVVINSNLKPIYKHEFSKNDKPDSEMPEDVAKNLPTNSDLTTGILLKDGRVALAGRIYMPANPAEANPYGNDRNNFALMVILDESGKF